MKRLLMLLAATLLLAGVLFLSACSESTAVIDDGLADIPPNSTIFNMDNLAGPGALFENPNDPGNPESYIPYDELYGLGYDVAVNIKVYQYHNPLMFPPYYGLLEQALGPFWGYTLEVHEGYDLTRYFVAETVVFSGDDVPQWCLRQALGGTFSYMGNITIHLSFAPFYFDLVD